MGVVIDFIYVTRELLKLSFMVMISPPGIVAAYLMMWK